VRFVVCYRPPYYDANASDYLSELLECLELLVTHKNPTVIVGDFNFPKFDWVNMSAKCDKFDKVFLDFVVQNGFMQYVSDPTRGVNLLDLVLCNDLFLISDCNVCPPINGCDHNSIEFSVQYKAAPEPEAPSIIVYDFKHADFEGLNMFLSNIDWNNVQTMLILCGIISCRS